MQLFMINLYLLWMKLIMWFVSRVFYLQYTFAISLLSALEHLWTFICTNINSLYPILCKNCVEYFPISPSKTIRKFCQYILTISLAFASNWFRKILFSRCKVVIETGLIQVLEKIFKFSVNAIFLSPLGKSCGPTCGQSWF